MNTEMRAGARHSSRLGVVGLLLVLLGLLAVGAAVLPSTADETAHMAGGYSVITRRAEALDVLSQRGYPPLMPALQGTLIALGHPQIAVTALPGWPDAFDIFAESFADALPSYDRALFISRMPAIWLTVLMAAIVYRWAALAFGRVAGLVALGLCLVDPTLLAHGRLATTDAGVTCFGLASLYAAWRWTRVGGWRWSLACGALLGATMMAKISGPLWLVAVALIMMVGILRRHPRRAGTGLLHIAVAVCLGFAVLWAVYGFQVGPLAGAGVAVPAPSHWESALYLSRYHSLFFALGERQREGWWWYFPVAFLIKNPVPLLLLWLLGVLAVLPRRRSLTGLQGLFAGRSWDVSRLAYVTVLTFPVVYSIVATFEGMNIGYRHMLPVHPLLHIAAGLGVATVWRLHRPLLRVGLILLGATCAVTTWRLFPDELVFFSALIGGPERGYRYLVDSNLDWGQHADTLDAYLASHPDVSPRPPETSYRPAPGRYIVGASQLQGIGVADPSAYAWFRNWEPFEQPVAGLLVYDVPPFDAAWVAQCGEPVLPLTVVQVQTGVGPDVRLVSFDCTRAWLFPGGGAQPGIYALHADHLAPRTRQFPSGLLEPPLPADAALRRRLTSARLALCNERAAPPFALYEHAPGATSPGPAMATPVYSTAAEAPPSAVAGGSQIANCADLKPETPACPCAMDGPLTFLGVSVVEEGDGLAIESWWRVEEGPVTRNFSLMGHLLKASGEVLETDDGLGVFPTTLLAGDVFVQRHRFSKPGEAPALWFRTGAYWLDTLARWATGDVGADVFLIPVR